MREGPIQIDPPRLMDTDTEAGRALRAARADPNLRGDEAAAWRGVQRRLTRPTWTQRARYLALGAAAGVLLVAGGLGLWRYSVRSPVPVPAVVSADPVIVPGQQPTDLPSGSSALSDGTRLELSSRGMARIRREEQRVTVALHRGSINVLVTSRPPGREFAVEADGFRFNVIGTRFRVLRNQESIELQVREGRVAVLGPSGPLTTVSAGQSWRSSMKPPADAASPPEPTAGASNGKREPPPAASAESGESAADCLRLAREHRAEAAAECYERVAAGRGLSAEMAQVELARLRRDVLHDSSGALRALRGYLSRYPNGAFRTEAAISVVEVLAQLGKTQEALAESERLLLNGAARERETELRLLRGRILQDRLGDCGRAEREYARVAADPGPIGDQAQLRQARCLEALGRSDEAITTYRAYLDRAHPANAPVARTRLQALSGAAP